MTHFKQPQTLHVFFLTEMWERYGFYVIQTLLAIYLALHFNWPDRNVYALVGSFTAITYLSPFIGGYIADKLLGQKGSILLGAFILFISYLLLSFTDSETLMIQELAFIAVGTGLLKPNISSLLGAQYTQENHLREHGFTIFYLGITAGIILGTTLPGIFHHFFGWKIAFFSAAVGMLFSISTFLRGVMKFKIENNTPLNLTIKNSLFTLGIVFFVWFFCKTLLLNPHFADIMFPLICLVALYYLLYIIFKNKIEAKKTTIILFLCLVSILFWSFYFQMFMSLTLFILRVVQNNLFGVPLTPPNYVTIQSIGILVIGYLMTKKKLKGTLEEIIPSIMNKFLIALFCILIAYTLITNLCFMTQNNEKIPVLLLIPTYLLISLGELLLSPVGISAITLLSPPEKVSRMMGIFYASLGLGGFLSGKLSSITALETTHLTISQLKTHYGFCFLKLSIILSICMVFSLIYNYFLKTYLKNKTV